MMTFMELVSRHRNGYDLKAVNSSFDQTLHISKSGRIYMLNYEGEESGLYLFHIRSKKWEIEK